MAKLKEENKSEVHMKIGSLEVIHNISGAGIKQIQTSVKDLQKSVSTVIAKTNDYWSAIAADNVITPAEKKDLKKEWNVIQQTYTAIVESATSGGILQEDVIQDYIDAHQELFDVIYMDEKILDNMSENTNLKDAAAFTEAYNNYYEKEFEAQKAITKKETVTDVAPLVTPIIEEKVKEVIPSVYPHYLGPYEEEEAPDPMLDSINLGDWYFNKTPDEDGEVHLYRAEYDETTGSKVWSKVTYSIEIDYMYSAAAKDILAYSGDTGEVGHFAAAYISHIFAGEITATNCEIAGTLAINKIQFNNSADRKNFSIGINALKYFNQAGENNLAIGEDALRNNNGNLNIAIGLKALQNNTRGSQNLAIGYAALLKNIAGSQNIALGTGALGEGETNSNIAIGEYSLQNSTNEGIKNVAIGLYAGQHNENGSQNVFIGNEAGQNNKGINNVFLGNKAGENHSTGNNNVIIGSNAEVEDPTGDNQININNLLKYASGVLNVKGASKFFPINIEDMYSYKGDIKRNVDYTTNELISIKIDNVTRIYKVLVNFTQTLSGIGNWREDNTYSLNYLVYDYDDSNKTYIYQSLISNNKNNALTDTNSWLKVAEVTNNYYIKFANGLKIQWGKKTGNTDFGAINYPISFTTTPAVFTQLIATKYENTLITIKIHNTSDNLHLDYSEKYLSNGSSVKIGNAVEEFYWVAIGY